MPYIRRTESLQALRSEAIASNLLSIIRADWRGPHVLEENRG
jgi:hypothetical protein